MQQPKQLGVALAKNITQEINKYNSNYAIASKRRQAPRKLPGRLRVDRVCESVGFPTRFLPKPKNRVTRAFFKTEKLVFWLPVNPVFRF